MTTILRKQHLLPYQKSYTQNRYDFRRFMHPRLCMIISVTSIFIGICLPIFMVMGVVPANLTLSFLGFGMVSTGSTMTLINCGEL